MGVTHGEALIAIASVLGGLISAGGAVGAVYFMLRGQREEERQRLVYAILREVMEFCRLIVGNLKICETIKPGNPAIPAAHFPTIMRMPKAVIYPAIADRLGLLNNPALVVTFFTRMSAAESLAAMVGAQEDIVSPEVGAEIARGWIDICEMGKCILTGEQEFKRDVDRQAREDILKQIEGALESARKKFPEEQA